MTPSMVARRDACPARLRPLAAAALAMLSLAACRTGGDDAPASGTSAGDGAPVSSERIVTLGGAVTETVFALGLGDAIVAVDQSSVYPEEAQSKPKAGYYRALSAEPLLAMRPSLMLLDDDAGPPDALAQIEAAGVRVARSTGGPSVDAVAGQMLEIARAVGQEARGQALVDTLRAQVARAQRGIPAGGARPRVIYVQGQGGGMLALAGSGTNADALVTLAGGINALAAASGYTPLTPEAIADAAPDVIVATARTVQVAGGAEAFLKRPGVAQTPAARNGRLVVLEDRLMNFGPTLGEGVQALVRGLHGGAAPEPAGAGAADSAGTANAGRR